MRAFGGVGDGAGKAAHFAASGVALTIAPLRERARRAFEAETRAAERRMRRAMLGSCECGEVAGEVVCPWCDREDIPADLRAAGAAARREERVRRAERDVLEALTAITEQKQKIANRLEKRRGEMVTTWGRFPILDLGPTGAAS